MSAAVPSTVALTTIADGAAIVASDHRNNYTAVQTAINALVAVGALATAKGDVLVATTSGTYDRLAVGTTGQQLVADSTQTLGVKWVGGMSLVSDSTLSVAAASFDITGIPTGGHLLVVVQGRGDTAATSTPLLMRFNNDTAANYDYQPGQVSGAGTFTGTEAFASTSINCGNLTAASAAASLSSQARIAVDGYSGTTFNKTAIVDGLMKRGVASGDLFRNFQAGFWRSTAAINRVTIFPSAGNFAAGSRCSVYVMGV